MANSVSSPGEAKLDALTAEERDIYGSILRKYSNSLINIAPEVIENQQYSYKSDVYSFGILMYQIVTDCKPYPIFETKKITEFEFKKKVVEEKNLIIS